MKDLCDSIRNATFLLGMLARRWIEDPETRLEILKQANKIDKALLKHQLKMEGKNNGQNRKAD